MKLTKRVENWNVVPGIHVAFLHVDGEGFLPYGVYMPEEVIDHIVALQEHHDLRKHQRRNKVTTA